MERHEEVGGGGGPHGPQPYAGTSNGMWNVSTTKHQLELQALCDVSLAFHRDMRVEQLSWVYGRLWTNIIIDAKVSLL